MKSGGSGSLQVRTVDSDGSPQVAGLRNFGDSIRRTAVVPPFLLFAVGYAFAYQYTGGFGESVPSPLWLPDSILLCALLLVSKRFWALYLLTGFAIRIVHGGVPFWFLT